MHNILCAALRQLASAVLYSRHAHALSTVMQFQVHFVSCAVLGLVGIHSGVRKARQLSAATMRRTVLE
jgi:hypothetical protein